MLRNANDYQQGNHDVVEQNDNHAGHEHRIKKDLLLLSGIIFLKNKTDPPSESGPVLFAVEAPDYDP